MKKDSRGILAHYTTVKRTRAHNVGLGSSYLKRYLTWVSVKICDVECMTLKKMYDNIFKQIKNAWTLK